LTALLAHLQLLRAFFKANDACRIGWGFVPMDDLIAGRENGAARQTPDQVDQDYCALDRIRTYKLHC
jgi:hypothetical protein